VTTIAGLTITRSSFQEPDCYDHFSQSLGNTDLCRPSLIVILKTIALRTANEDYHQAARFWARIFAINFAMGVVTGIPMEFQFGTNWAAFSRSAGGVIGQTLAMEAVFAFFLESSFLGLFLFGEKRIGPGLHWVAAFLIFVGS
jgi:cytochrome d ubiquinol oxidase subunit I